MKLKHIEFHPQISNYTEISTPLSAHISRQPLIAYSPLTMRPRVIVELSMQLEGQLDDGFGFLNVEYFIVASTKTYYWQCKQTIWEVMPNHYHEAPCRAKYLWCSRISVKHNLVNISWRNPRIFLISKWASLQQNNSLHIVFRILIHLYN